MSEIYLKLKIENAEGGIGVNIELSENLENRNAYYAFNCIKYKDEVNLDLPRIFANFHPDNLIWSLVRSLEIKMAVSVVFV